MHQVIYTKLQQVNSAFLSDKFENLSAERREQTPSSEFRPHNNPQH